MIKCIIRISQNVLLLTILLLLSSPFAKAAGSRDTQASPPPGWQAAGESVAGPEETSTTIQTAARDSADTQTRYGRDTQIKKSDNRGYIYYGAIYDEYPYRHGIQRPITPRNIHKHVDYRYNNRMRRKGVYVYTD